MSSMRVYLRFWSGIYYNCLLIQDGATGKYGWYWPGATEHVKPPYDVQQLIDVWQKSGCYAGLSLEEFLKPILGEES